MLAVSIGTARAQFTKAELQISGLTCALCAKTTERSLKSFSFVSDVKTDLSHNIYIITFRKGEAVNFDQISKSVHDAGFFVNSLKVTFNFDNVAVANNQFSCSGDTYQVVNAVEKPLNGAVALTIVDKGFAPRSVSKKYLGQTADGVPSSGRLYHVAI